MKNEKKNIWVFLFQKYGKFWSVSLDIFIEHKLKLWCVHNTVDLIYATYKFWNLLSFSSFLALACDSFAMKNLTDKNYASEDWTTMIPNFDELGPLPSSVSNPPFLPPHLSHNILNKKDFATAAKSTHYHADSTILPEPMSHVMLHHLYAQSIRDHLLVFASTERYRKKCVTIIYYRPIDWWYFHF